jgi:uncharacterized membrane protein YsdA (DUF1294 family)
MGELEIRLCLLFGVISALSTAWLFQTVSQRADLGLYLTWLAAISGTTFAIYGLDKLLSVTPLKRVPESFLDILALLGGFPGGWLGMGIFHHKSNRDKHPWIWFWLTLSTIGHLVLAGYLLFRSSQAGTI